jgi:hypothetical protein
MTSWISDFSISSPQEEIKLLKVTIPSLSTSPKLSNLGSQEEKEWQKIKIPSPIEDEEKLFDIMPPKPL